MDFPLRLGSAVCLSPISLCPSVYVDATMTDSLCREDGELLGQWPAELFCRMEIFFLLEFGFEVGSVSDLQSPY